MKHVFSSFTIALICSCATISDQTYLHESEEIGSVRDVYSADLAPDIQVNTFRNTHRLFATRTVARGTTVSEIPYAEDIVSGIRFDADSESYSFDDYIALNRVGGLLVLNDGKIVHESYHLGNTEETRWMSMSVAKTITATLVGAAIQDGYIESLEDPITQYVKTLKDTPYDGVSVRNLLNMTSGVKWDETYTNVKSDRRRLLEAQLKQEQGAMLEVMASLPRIAEPGTIWNYSTGETQVVAELVQSATGRSLSDYLSQKIWAPIGAESDATWWLDAPGGVEVGGSGLAARMRDYGRFGQFLLDGGEVNGESVLPPGWMEEATMPVAVEDAPYPYGFMIWPHPNIPGYAHAGAYEAAGIFGQKIYVNPPANTVVVILSAWPEPVYTPPVNEHAFLAAVLQALDENN